jgi:photosystem II stability/assembly factor-like uncharacterized protein
MMKNMKNIAAYLTLIASLLISGQVKGQWAVEKCPTKYDLNSISYSSDGTGWIVGDKGIILMKSDVNWKLIESPTEENLYSLTFNDKNDGWAVGSNGVIIYYNGKIWQKVESPSKWDLYSVSFNTMKKGIAVGEHGTILFYDNGRWGLHENKFRGKLFSASFAGDDVWIGGGLECVRFPIIQMTSNKGNLSVNSFKSDAMINSVSFLNPDEGWAAGSPSTILHYNGKSWEVPVTTEKFSSLRSIFFSDINNGISAGYGGTIMIYKNNIWSKESFSTTEDLNSVTISNGIYYAVGNNGTIIKKDYNNSNNRYLDPNAMEMGIEIFPNPCDERLNISLNFENHAEKVRLILTSTSGKSVMEKEHSLINGNSECFLSTDALANGLYLLQIVNGSKSFISKIMVSH